MTKSAMHGSSKNDLGTVLAGIQRYCAYQERCSHEVYQKLVEWKVPPDNISEIVAHLTEEGFLDDGRFACIYVRSKYHIKKWGRTKIRYELKNRNIPEKIVQRAMEEINEEDYLKTIRELILKKMSEINSAKHLNIREKIITFVTGKGFEFDLISKVFTELKI